MASQLSTSALLNMIRFPIILDDLDLRKYPVKRCQKAIQPTWLQEQTETPNVGRLVAGASEIETPIPASRWASSLRIPFFGKRGPLHVLELDFDAAVSPHGEE